ncbi:hypothetical protein C5613_12850 [Rhodococcus opacus]|uniref:Uncharacterized protein n=1 Tax=Rhodococcus opacus TaxID=37919 RepID=A0A2S8JBN3_RHOOP|nr:hypothetical protein C5613_12850 [Rhodococcus opacus]
MITHPPVGRESNHSRSRSSTVRTSAGSLRLQTRTPASFGGAKEFVAGVRLKAEDDELDGWRGREARAARPMSQQFNLIARR